MNTEIERGDLLGTRRIVLPQVETQRERLYDHLHDRTLWLRQHRELEVEATITFLQRFSNGPAMKAKSRAFTCSTSPAALTDSVCAASASSGGEHSDNRAAFQTDVRRAARLKPDSHHEDRACVVGVQREAERQEEVVTVDAKAGGVADLRVCVSIPDRAGVEEHRDVGIAILDRRMEHALTTDGRNVVFVKSAKRRGVTEREALEERRLTADVPERDRAKRLAASLLVAIARLSKMALVDQVAIEPVDRSAQRITPSARCFALPPSVAIGRR